MNHMRSFRAIVLATVLVVVHVLSMPMSVAAGAGEPPTLPETIAVPPGSVMAMISDRQRCAGVIDYTGGLTVLLDGEATRHSV